MFTLGITGGMGSGKTTASNFFINKGAIIFNADQESKKYLKSNIETQKDIIDVFGTKVLNNNKLDLKKLAEVVFSEKKYQLILNKIMWPKIFSLIQYSKNEAKKNKTILFIVDAALLFESRYTKYFDSILLITAPENIRIKRIIARDNISIEQINNRISLQMQDDDKRNLANFTINNSGSLADFYNNLENYYNSIIV
tara:strand:- start:50 stop:640 length:591 start_codon:yes stop_codon:yes gene_type:complete